MLLGIFLENNLCDPDSNYFNTAVKNFDTPYVIPWFHSQLEDHIFDGSSFLHINIRSINKNFENLKNFSFLPSVLHLV